MCSTTLTTTLLLTVAALISGAVLPPGLGRPVGLGLRCRNIGAQAVAARAHGLGTTASLISPRDTETAVVDLSSRDLPGTAPCGILRGNQSSAAFTLEPSNKWNAYWVDDRVVLGGTVLLWELGGNNRRMVEAVAMHQRHLTPFKPEVNRQYVLELFATGPEAEQAVISWYIATQ